MNYDALRELAAAAQHRFSRPPIVGEADGRLLSLLLDEHEAALDAMRQALDALENGKRVRACEGGTTYQPPLEDAAIKALRAALGDRNE